MNDRVNPNIAHIYDPTPKKIARESNEVTCGPESPHIDGEKRNMSTRY